VLSRWFISPAQHQVHHSIDKKHFHRNMGWALAVWDRLSGTLYIPETEEKIVYGLGDGSEGDYHGVVRMYFLPVVRAITWCVARSRK
jgi:sterol desaturase/sphingolipid hydroxylase (fatty acid hydroxylase superfamily)